MYVVSNKTGTLTGEDLVFEGLAGFLKTMKIFVTYIAAAEHQKVQSRYGAAHALVKLDDGDVVGDPMEKATLKAIGWAVEKKNTTFREGTGKLNVIRRFQFSSALKRSASVASHNDTLFAAVKGAPETIRERLSNIPKNYDDIYKSFTRSGSRVLALASKQLPKLSQSKIDDLTRDEVESDLIFNGFLIFHCPLKEDAIETIKMLNESPIRSVMITGDNPLTAVHVAKEVELFLVKSLILDRAGKSDDGQLLFQ